MEVEGASAEAFVGGGDADPNEAVFHDGEPSSPSSDSGQTIRFSKILEVDVVMEELLQYLSVREMKVLSSISKDALIAVRNSKVFSRRLVFKICERSILSRVLDHCFYSWKHVRFVTFICDNGVEDYLPKSSTISHCLNFLQSFSFEVSYLNYPQESLKDKINTVGLKIIESSKETLEYLDLKLFIPSSGLDGLESIRCPNLKSLNLICYANGRNNQELIEQLLRNLPPLEKLSVDVCHPSKLFATLQGRMSKLRELGIRILWHEDSTLAPAFDWNMVAEISRLAVLSIKLCYSRCKTSAQDVEELLLSIPAKTVTKFSLASSFGRELRFIQKLHKSISHFTKLTELSLCDLDSFDDDSLQGIIKTCPNLKNLELALLFKVTDFGISGVPKSPTRDGFHFGLQKRGVSLTDLRDLTTLTIKWCGILSMANLLEVIRFKSLTSLCFESTVRGWEAKSPREFLHQILQQNPSLKKVCLGIVDIVDYDDDYTDSPSVRYCSLEHEARRLFPQISELMFEYPITDEYIYASDGEYSERDSGSSDSDSD